MLRQKKLANLFLVFSVRHFLVNFINGHYVNQCRPQNLHFSFRYVFPSSMTVQSFIAIKWQEKKLSIIKILKFLVSDHLNCLNTIAGQSSATLYATAKTKTYTPIFVKSQTGVELRIFTNLNCCYSFRIQLMWPKLCVALVSRYDLLSQLNLKPLSYSFLFRIHVP